MNYSYVHPKELSRDCIDELNRIRDKKNPKETSEDFRKWESKFFKEIKEYEESCVYNMSNFVYCLSRKDFKTLDTFLFKPGFSRKKNFDGTEEYICNYSDAIAFSC